MALTQHENAGAFWGIPDTNDSAVWQKIDIEEILLPLEEVEVGCFDIEDNYYRTVPELRELLQTFLDNIQ